MGDDQGRAPHQGLIQRALHLPLALRIEAAGGLVEHQHRRVGQDSSSQTEPLLLAARQGDASLADGRVVAQGERGDEFVGRGDDARGLELRPRRVRACDGEILARWSPRKAAALG